MTEVKVVVCDGERGFDVSIETMQEEVIHLTEGFASLGEVKHYLQYKDFSQIGRPKEVRIYSSVKNPGVYTDGWLSVCKNDSVPTTFGSYLAIVADEFGGLRGIAIPYLDDIPAMLTNDVEVVCIFGKYQNITHHRIPEHKFAQEWQVVGKNEERGSSIQVFHDYKEVEELLEAARERGELQDAAQYLVYNEDSERVPEKAWQPYVNMLQTV